MSIQNLLDMNNMKLNFMGVCISAATIYLSSLFHPQI